MSESCNLLCELISCVSITPNDGGAFNLLESRLQKLGFNVKRKKFSQTNTKSVENFYARLGNGKPHLCFAGHVDVVAPGDLSLWRCDPFKAKIENDILYGRGAVDMKGGIACFIVALEEYIKSKKNFGSISILLTADEEGPAINGTKEMLAWLDKQGEKFDACLVGEPTCANKIGDIIKIGRRGSLSAVITQEGVQGHVAYPELAKNPLPILLNRLYALSNKEFDKGTKDFQATNLELTSIDTKNETFNIIPGQAHARFNVRFNEKWNVEKLKTEIENCLSLDETLTIQWQTPSECFKTEDEFLIKALQQSIEQVCAISPQLQTGGGTSDARFIKNYCSVIEFGLIGRTMHQIDESVAVGDLQSLVAIYEKFIETYFLTSLASGN